MRETYKRYDTVEEDKLSLTDNTIGDKLGPLVTQKNMNQSKTSL